MTSSSAGGPAFLTGFGTNLDSELAELFFLDLRRSSAHRIDTGLVLGKGDHVAEVRLAREDHHHSVDPEGDPAVWRRAHREGVEEEAELRALLLGGELKQREDPRLDVGLVDPDGAASELLAVSDEVVSVRKRARGVLVEALLEAGSRPRERVVHGGPALVLLRPFEHREIRDPNQVPRLLVDQPELAAQMKAKCPEDAGDHGGPISGEKDGLPRVAAEERELLLGEELRDRRADFPLLVPDEVGEALCPPFLRDPLETIELRAGEGLGDADEPHGRRTGEDAELRRT